MPKRTDIKSILILGAGPIVIGQACEFDYSGTQSCRALKEEGYRVILVNSNPATIMTDPQMADATYIEPVNWEAAAKIIEKEKPDAILPTMGGQTALNCALDLAREGILKKFGVEMIGAKREAIDKAEDREKFKKAMEKIGLEVPKSRLAHNLQEAEEILKEIGFPAIIRPSFTLGGSGGGIAYNRTEFAEICENGFDQSPTHEILIDESIIGWKEYELEVVRDKNDNCIVVCSIENFDPMGIHTGDSITVAPAQTLTDKEYQRMRNAAIAILREIGIETGGSNVQFAVNPEDGRMFVIEMNPRVSRSSAMASKATGFPIAKVAAKLAIGYTLDELKNEITNGQTPASFEPVIDYIVTKIPRFNFEKFPRSIPRLTTQMKSVGEVMAIGRSFQESLQKTIRGLEIDVDGLDTLIELETPNIFDIINYELRMPGAKRLWHIANAFRLKLSLEEIYKLTQIDSWFLVQIEDLVKTEKSLAKKSLLNLNKKELYQLKRKGFSDRRLAALLNTTEQSVRNYRHSLNIRPVYKRVDTCAAEFSTTTGYLYSAYEEECEAAPTNRKKIMALGGGPNRIGQGIEFDYCCVHAAQAMQESGYETIMVNCNPETVSTDFDISDRLYFEPLTLEDVLEIVDLEKPKGVIVQYGGQTPLKLANHLNKANVPIIGTSTDAIDCAEDREKFQKLIQKLDLLQPPNVIIRSAEEGLRLADVFSYPLVVRPSYVLGGKAMEIIPNATELRRYMNESPIVSPDKPLLLDYFIDNAIEAEIDAVCDGKKVVICGIMEHIEPAGIHSGDSACCFPSKTLSAAIQNEIKGKITKIALELGVIGLINAQFAICNEKIYLLEINPRASRTIPFISKATGVPWAKIASRCMIGKTLTDQNITSEIVPKLCFVKESVLPFHRFPGSIPLMGPEMKSTGEVMGIGATPEEAFYKAQLGAGFKTKLIPNSYILINSLDISKNEIEQIKKIIQKNRYEILAPSEISDLLNKYHIPFTQINQICGKQLTPINLLKSGKIQLIIHITSNKLLSTDIIKLLEIATYFKVLYTTTFRGTLAILSALSQKNSINARRLQDINKET